MRRFCGDAQSSRYDRPDLKRFRQHEPIGQTMEDISLTRPETQRQRGDEILDTSPRSTVHRWCDNRATCFPPRCMEGNPIIATGSFGRITLRPSATSAEHEAAVLQVPTSGASGLAASTFPPQKTRAFLIKSLSTPVASEAGMTCGGAAHARVIRRLWAGIVAPRIAFLNGVSGRRRVLSS